MEPQTVERDPLFRRLRTRLSDRERWPRRWWHPPIPQPREPYSIEDLADRHAKCSETIRRTFLTLLAISLFCLVTALGTPDRAFLVSEVTVKAPVADVPLSFKGFLVAAPFVLVVISIYLHVFVGYARDLEHYAGSFVKVPVLFNLPHPLARPLAAFIFYWLVPLVLLVMAWTASARPIWGFWMFWFANIALWGFVFLQIRRRPEGNRRWSNRLGWLLLGLIPIAGVQATLFMSDIHRSLNLEGENLSKRWLFNAYLDRANLSRANLSEATLSSANLFGANLFGANLRGADLFKANLKVAKLIQAELAGANLGGANLKVANLLGANLLGANLKGANLNGAFLFGANLKGANLKGADLGGANLKGANLKGADLGGANLDGANLVGVTRLKCLQLKQAKLWQRSFRDPALACGAPIPTPPKE